MFSSDRLLFRGFREEGVDDLYSMRNDFDVQRFLTSSPVVPLPTKHKDILKAQAEDSVIWFSIILKDTGEFVGHCQIMAMSQPKDRDGTFAIAVRSKFWGKGYGTEASKFIIGHAFEALGIQRVSLTVHDGNAAAIALYEKLGFKHEATKRRAIWAEGRWRNLLYMGVLEEEWATLHK